MTLDSKDSDIEQLRSQLQALHIGMDSSSIGSGPGEVEPDDGFPGTRFWSALYLFAWNVSQLRAFRSMTDSALEKNIGHFLEGKPTFWSGDSRDILDLFH